MAVVLVPSAIALIPKFKKRQFSLSVGIQLWVFGLLASILGSFISQFLSVEIISGGYFIILLAAATLLIRSKVMAPLDSIRHKRKKTVLISLLIGFLTGVFGVGGGFLAVPFLRKYFHMNHADASGTSLVMISLNSITSIIAHANQLSTINWFIVIPIAIVSTCTSTFSAIYAGRVDDELAKKFFLCLLILAASLSLLKIILGT